MRLLNQLKAILLLALISYSCGKNDYGLKVIGGELVTQAPFMVGLSRGVMEEGFACGGVLIKNNIVLTAAECINDNDLKSVMVGDNIASVFLPILSTIVHPNYRRNDKLSKHNIGLIEIDLAKLPKDIRLRPIKIKKYNLPSLRKTSHKFMGRGSHTSTGLVSDNKLYQINVSLTDSKECSNNYRQKLGLNLIDKSLVCGKVRKGYQADCKADTGSPLLAYTGNKPYVDGILSGAIICSSDLPRIYTKAAHYIKWMESEIKNLKKNRAALTNDHIRHLIQKNCTNTTTESIKVNNLPKGFLIQRTLFDANKVEIREMNKLGYVNGELVAKCGFKIAGRGEATFEFLKTSLGDVSGVFTTSKRKWLISPRQLKKVQLSCFGDSHNIDLEWLPGQPVSKVYTISGEFDAYLTKEKPKFHEKACSIDGLKLLIYGNQNNSDARYLEVKGSLAPQGIYKLYSHSDYALTTIMSIQSKLIQLNIINSSPYSSFSHQIACSFPFQITSQGETYSSKPVGKKNVLFFGRHSAFLSSLSSYEHVSLTLIPTEVDKRMKCSVNGKAVHLISRQ